MANPAASSDQRQGVLFEEMNRPVPPYRSDERARADMMAMVETVTSAKVPPWSARLLGWQRRTFAVLAQKLTPIEAAALTSQWEAELERLGPPED